jgi:uncharacterized cupin superfamily protein
METPKYVVHADAVAVEEGHYPAPFDAERLSLGKNLGLAAGSVRVGLWLERIPPGRRTSFTHAHSHEEELIYVLAGTCHVRLLEPGAEPVELPLRAGHTVSFPSGTRIAHSFVNHGAADCEILCFGERRRDVDRCSYPEEAAYTAWVAANRADRHWADEGNFDAQGSATESQRTVTP